MLLEIVELTRFTVPVLFNGLVLGGMTKLGPKLEMPPPALARLWSMAQLVTVKTPVVWFKMPPPPSLPGAFPLKIVRPEIAALKFPKAMIKMPKLMPLFMLRCTVSLSAPGPLIVRFLLIINSPLVSVIGLLTLGAKIILLPAQALAMMKRREPDDPSSRLLVTTGLMQPGSWSACIS